jgi:hypothetical protein
MKIYRFKRAIICYIKQVNNGYKVCTGKPSDAFCISWYYDSLEEAERTAQEYFDNYTSIL